MSDIPQDIIDQYGLREKAVNGKVLVEIRKGMYGLKQAGCIANGRLKQHLKQHLKKMDQYHVDTHPDSSPTPAEKYPSPFVSITLV